MEIESKIIIGLKKNNAEALKMLHSIYSKKIFYFIYSYTHNTEITEELVQDVFVKLWNNRRTLKKLSSLKNYIYTIAKNLTIDFLRKRKKVLIIPIDTIVGEEIVSKNFGEEKIISLERIGYIHRIIERLSPRKKEVFKMQRFEKLTYKAISEKLEISVSAVEKNMSSALKEIRHNLIENNI